MGIRCWAEPIGPAIREDLGALSAPTRPGGGCRPDVVVWPVPAPYDSSRRGGAAPRSFPTPGTTPRTTVPVPNRGVLRGVFGSLLALGLISYE